MSTEPTTHRAVDENARSLRARLLASVAVAALAISACGSKTASTTTVVNTTMAAPTTTVVPYDGSVTTTNDTPTNRIQSCVAGILLTGAYPLVGVKVAGEPATAVADLADLAGLEGAVDELRVAFMPDVAKALTAARQEFAKTRALVTKSPGSSSNIWRSYEEKMTLTLKPAQDWLTTTCLPVYGKDSACATAGATALDTLGATKNKTQYLAALRAIPTAMLADTKCAASLK